MGRKRSDRSFSLFDRDSVAVPRHLLVAAINKVRKEYASEVRKSGGSLSWPGECWHEVESLAEYLDIVPYDRLIDCCPRCMDRRNFSAFEPINLFPHGHGFVGDYMCDSGHSWSCWWSRDRAKNHPLLGVEE